MLTYHVPMWRKYAKLVMVLGQTLFYLLPYSHVA